MYLIRFLFLNPACIWTLKIQTPIGKATERSQLFFREMIYFQSVFITLSLICLVGSWITEFLVGRVTGSSYQVSLWVFYSPFFVLGTFALNKDLVNGQGVVNRHFGYRVVDIVTEGPSTPIKCMLRNLTVIIFPIEFFFLQRSEKRIGDIMFGTKLLKVEPTSPDRILAELGSYKWDKSALMSLVLPLVPCIILTWMIAFTL